MDILNKLLSEKQKQPNVSGQWFAIQWTPDIATAERLNIGVGFVEQSGEISVSLLDYFERIACLYSKDMIFQLSLACDVSRELIFKRKIHDGYLTPQIRCRIGGFAQGKNTAEILSTLYKSIVPLGIKHNTPRSKNFTSTSRDALYNGLRNTLKINLEMDFHYHVPENPYQEILDGSRKQVVYLPFRKDDGIATLVSADYSDPQRVKCNIYDGYRDIDIAFQHLKSKSKAIFVLLPDDSLKPEHKNSIENSLDQFIWFMNKHNVFVESHITPTNLADEISTWCKTKAA